METTNERHLETCYEPVPAFLIVTRVSVFGLITLEFSGHFIETMFVMAYVPNVGMHEILVSLLPQ